MERAYQSDRSDFVGWCRQTGVVATLNRRVAAITAAHRMMRRTRRSQTCWLASDRRMGPGRTRRPRFWVDYIALPRRFRDGSITVMDGRVLEHRGGRVLCAGGPRRGRGPRSEAAAVGKVARNPRRVCIAARRSQRILADLIAGWIRQPGPTQWLRGAPFFFIDEKLELTTLTPLAREPEVNSAPAVGGRGDGPLLF